MIDIVADTTIVTYGGGEYLAKVLDAIAMLMNDGGKNSFVRPLAAICATICMTMGISKVLFADSMESLLTKYLFPIIIFSSLLMVPTTTVKIDDILTPCPRTIENVPLLLGKFTSLASNIGYQITTAIETAFHTPSDAQYEKTGMIFGSEAAIDLNRYKVTNAQLEQNMREFSKQCVMYDIALGRYSLDSLKKSTDLWKFFEENTSNVRMIRVLNPNTNSNTNNKETERDIGTYRTCKEAIYEMRGWLNNEAQYYEKTDMLKNLPYAFQALTRASKSQEDIIGQQLMMSMLAKEFDGNGFAKTRADIYQKSYMNTMGSLSAKTIVGTRVAIEVIVYAAFVLIIPLTMLPGGFRFISSWVWLVIWIQMWPPFFSIINYIMLLVIQSKAKMLFPEGTSSLCGLSFYTNIGLQEIQDQVYAMGGVLSASVPYITYTFLKGGVHAIGSFANHITSPLSSAASVAASEQASGNYSFGNASMGNLSYRNDSAFQTNIAPLLKSQHITSNDGATTITYGAEDQIIKQDSSAVRMSFTAESLNSSNISNVKSHAEAATSASEKAYTESISTHARNTASMVDTLSHSENYSSSLSQSESVDIQQSASELKSMADTFGKSYGLSSRDSLEVLASVSAGARLPDWIPILKLSADGQIKTGSSIDSSELMNAALNVVNSSEFRENFQKVNNFSENKAASALTDEGQRIAYDYSKSFEEAKSSQEAFRVAKTISDQMSETASWLEQNSQHIKYEQTYEFQKWLNDSERISNSDFDRITGNGTALERALLLNYFHDFACEKYSSIGSEPVLFNYQNPNEKYINLNREIPSMDAGSIQREVDQTYFEMNNETRFNPGMVEDVRKQLDNFNAGAKESIGALLDNKDREGRVNSYGLQQQVSEEANKWLLRRGGEHLLDKAKLIFSDQFDPNSFNIKSQPFWHKED